VIIIELKFNQEMYELNIPPPAAFLMIVCFFSNDSESLIERWKRNDMSNLLELHNKTPVWNEGKLKVRVN
jgi:hypothetical protein